jgi:hypothetical protein
MVKIVIVPSSKYHKEAISLARSLHGKHGCEVLLAVHNTEILNFSNVGIQAIPFNNLKDIEYQIIVNAFNICISFSNEHETKDSNIFFLKVRKVLNDEFTLESKKGVIKTKIKDNNFVEDQNKDIPLLTTIYKNSSYTSVYKEGEKQIILRGSEESSERFPVFQYKLKNYDSKKDGSIIIKPLCNWENSYDLFNDFKRFSKDGKGKWNNIILDPSSTSPDYYLVLNSTHESFNPSKTIWFCMEPKMETHPAWKDFCELMNKNNVLYNGSHSLQMNNVEWHLTKSYNELLTYKVDKKYDKVLSVVVSDRCVDEGHKLRLDFISDLDKRKDLGFDVHIYGKCASLNFKNYKGELPKASKDNGIFPYKYHFNAENHSYDNYVTEKFTDGIVGETVFFYWGCPNVDKYYDKDSFIRLSLRKEDREQDIEKVKNAIINDQWSKHIDIIRKEKMKMVKVYNMFPRIESILFLKDTTVLVEPLGDHSNPDTKVRHEYLVKQNFKDIQLVAVTKGMKVFLDVFSLSVKTNKNIMLIFNTTSVIDIHHRLIATISETRENEGKIPDIILLDCDSFLVTPQGGKLMLEELDKVFKSGVGISFEELYKKFFYKKL